MCSVLRSIKPYWLYLILIGKKTVEVGKDFPKSTAWNREVYLYCSKDMRSFRRILEKDREWMRKYLGKIACRFVCDKIVPIVYDVNEYYGVCMSQTLLSYNELNAYLNKRIGYGWHISALTAFDDPMELKVAKRRCNGNCEPCKYGVWERARGFWDEPKLVACKPITPPQSWCYVEVRG